MNHRGTLGSNNIKDIKKLAEYFGGSSIKQLNKKALAFFYLNDYNNEVGKLSLSATDDKQKEPTPTELTIDLLRRGFF
jgi:hypothetical protein